MTSEWIVTITGVKDFSLVCRFCRVWSNFDARSMNMSVYISPRSFVNCMWQEGKVHFHSQGIEVFGQLLKVSNHVIYCWKFTIYVAGIL